jgi:hypothetical protein
MLADSTVAWTSYSSKSIDRYLLEATQIELLNDMHMAALGSVTNEHWELVNLCIMSFREGTRVSRGRTTVPTVTNGKRKRLQCFLSG